MKVSLLQIKQNRKIYRAIWEAYEKGFHEHHISVSSVYSGNEDLVITCADTWDKVKVIFTDCKQKGIPYITNYVGHFNKEKILSIDDRERERDNPRPETVIFCNLIDYRGACHRYILNNKGDRYKQFKIEIVPQRDYKGLILLLEQFRPEYYSSIKNRQQWYKWAKSTIEEIRKYSSRSIVYIRHPNEIFFKEDKKGEIPLYDIYNDVGVNNCPFDALLSRAHSVVTLSSKASVHALLSGVPVYSWEQYSPAELIFNKNLQHINKPFLFNTETWFKDIVYSYWSLREIENGTYIEYLLGNLLNAKNSI